MKKLGFDNQKYLEMQSGRIRERIAEFGGKHAFDGVPAERADRLLFTAEKP